MLRERGQSNNRNVQTLRQSCRQPLCVTIPTQAKWQLRPCTFNMKDSAIPK
jgi:hypothetical protein